jgi:hypothetical protein
MRKKYCDQESVFAHLWNHADADGLWTGDASIMATEFGVSEDEAQDMLGELSDRHLIERVGTATYIVTRWRERDEPDEEEELEW